MNVATQSTLRPAPGIELGDGDLLLLIESLQHQLTALEEREQVCDRQRAELLLQRDALDLHRQEAEARYARLHADLDRHAAIVLEAEAALDQRQQQLVVEEEQLRTQAQHWQHDAEADIARQRADWQQELSRDRDQLATEWNQLQAARDAASVEETSQVGPVTVPGNEPSKESLISRVLALDERERVIERREVDLRKRTQFHEAHLVRLRTVLESQQRELVQLRQQQQQRIVQIHDSLRRRMNHLARFRAELDQRELRLEACDAQSVRLNDITEGSPLAASKGTDGGPGTRSECACEFDGNQ